MKYKFYMLCVVLLIKIWFSSVLLQLMLEFCACCNFVQKKSRIFSQNSTVILTHGGVKSSNMDDSW